MNDKIIHHPSFYIKEFNKLIFVILLLGIFQSIWAVIIFYLNYKNILLFYFIFKKINLIHLDWLEIHTIIKIYSMYSLLHAFYIILACIMSYFLKSKSWFLSALYFSLFPFVGFLFGIIQLPISLIFLKKIKSQEWNNFFKHYDSFNTMNTNQN